MDLGKWVFAICKRYIYVIVSVWLCGSCGLTKDSEEPYNVISHGTTHLHTAKNLHCIIPKKDLHR